MPNGVVHISIAFRRGQGVDGRLNIALKDTLDITKETLVCKAVGLLVVGTRNALPTLEGHISVLRCTMRLYLK